MKLNLFDLDNMKIIRYSHDAKKISLTQLTFTCSNSIIETIEKVEKYVQN